MSAGALIVIGLRLLIPLTILRWPLFGGIASMVIDGLDVVLISLMNLGGFDGHYHTLDKVLDSYYLSIEFYVALGWQNAWARWPVLVLFPFRMIGVVLFEVTHQRIMLFIFPNLFENWWLYVGAVARFWPRLTPSSWRSTMAPLVLLLIPKMGQEYLLHFAEAQPWDWFKRVVLRDAI